jgi:hypothetical protein
LQFKQITLEKPVDQGRHQEENFNSWNEWQWIEGKDWEQKERL